MAKISITYNAQTSELETAYKAFQTRFTLRNKILYTIVFLVAIVLGVDFIIKDPTGLPGYITTGLAAGILINNWLKPVLVRRKLFKTLSELNDESYTAAFYDDRIEIETIIEKDAKTETVAITPTGVYAVEEGSEAAKELSENPPELINPADEAPPKTVYILAETDLSVKEKDGLFILFVNRSTFHTIPLRCLSDEQAEALRQYFTDKAII